MNNNINDFDNFSCSARQKIMNSRTYARNIPSQPLQPYLESRSVLTKYSIMPIVDPRKEIKTPLNQQATFNPEHIFNPGNATAPWSGFASNVNKESDLRGQIFAIQECSQATCLQIHFLNFSKKKNLVQFLQMIILIQLVLHYLIMQLDNSLKI